jgi:hypothetical protein
LSRLSFCLSNCGCKSVAPGTPVPGTCGGRWRRPRGAIAELCYRNCIFCRIIYPYIWNSILTMTLNRPCRQACDRLLISGFRVPSTRTCAALRQVPSRSSKMYDLHLQYPPFWGFNKASGIRRLYLYANRRSIINSDRKTTP